MENFNDRIDVSDDAKGIAGRRIVCRHFATAFVSDPQALHVFGQGEESIKSFFEQQTLQGIETRYNEYIRARQEEKSLVSNHRFGAWLEWQASSMNSSRAEALINTPDHTVAVVIERRENRQQAGFDATFYDPNRTLTPVVHRDQELSQLAKLTFLECFPEVSHHPVATSHRGMTVTAFSPGRTRGDSCKFVDFAHESYQDQSCCFASTLYAALQFNIADALEPIAKEITGARYYNVNNLLKLGASMNALYKECPALAAAERDSGADVFLKAPELSVLLGLSSSEACHFLSAEYGGRPALQHAARHGHLEMVSAMTAAIVNLNDRYDIDDHLSDLLQGLPIQLPGSSRRSDSEETHASDPEQTRTLGALDPTDADELKKEYADTPALHLAAYNGHVGAYGIIADAMVKLELPAQDRAEILAARDSAGRPALWRAMATGQFDCYDALASATRQAGLDRGQTVELLTAREPATGTAAHQLALKLGMTEGCTRLVDVLGKLDVPKADIRDALLNVDRNGFDIRTLCAGNQEMKETLDHILNGLQPTPSRSPQRRPDASGGPRRRPASPTSEHSVSKRPRR